MDNDEKYTFEEICNYFKEEQIPCNFITVYIL